jgi:hypothetical protein
VLKRPFFFRTGENRTLIGNFKQRHDANYETILSVVVFCSIRVTMTSVAVLIMIASVFLLWCNVADSFLFKFSAIHPTLFTGRKHKPGISYTPFFPKCGKVQDFVLGHSTSKSCTASSCGENTDTLKMAFILANITDHLQTQPEVALSIASQELGWLYSVNVPE